MNLIEDFFIGLSNLLMWMGADLLLSGILGLIGAGVAYLLFCGILGIFLFLTKDKSAKKLRKKNQEKSSLNEEEKAEVAKLKKKHSNPGFQKGVDHKYLLWGDYPLKMVFFTWHIFMLWPLLFALWFLPDLEMWWRENLRNFCLISSFGSVVLMTILYWQRQIKQVWITEEGDLYYKIREQEKMLKYTDYKYVRVLGDDLYSFKIIFTDEKTEWKRLWAAGPLKFWPQKTISMSLPGFARLEDRQPVSAKYFTNEVGKSLLKAGFEIKPVLQNSPGGEGWLATRLE